MLVKTKRTPGVQIKELGSICDRGKFYSKYVLTEAIKSGEL